MAFKFNALLDFNNKDAVKGMADVARGWKNMKDSADKLKKGLKDTGDFLKTATLATAPLGAALGYGIKQAADFEAQMSLVQGALMATKDEVMPVTNAIKLLGATGKDTDKATEAALAFAQANFEVAEIVKALPSALTLADAAQIDMKTSTDSIVSVLKSFNLEASQTGEIVDTLALTATLTNTSVGELAAGMKSVAGISKDLGYDFKQTASAIGILAEGGLDATQAAGALKNAFATLARPTKETLKLFGGSKAALDEAVFSVVNGRKQFRSLEVVMANLSKVVNQAPDPLKAVADAADIFGIKGTEAFRKFESQLLDTTTVSEKNIERLRAGIAASGEDMTVNLGDVIPKLVAVRLEIAGAAGSADKIAKINLSNARSNFEKIFKVMKSLNREAGDLVLQSLGPLLKTGAELAQVLGIGFQVAAGRMDAMTAATMLGDNSMKDMLQSSIEFSQGFIEGFKEVKQAALDTFNTIQGILEPIIGSTGMTAKEFGNLAAKIFFVGAIVAPVAAAILGTFAVIGSAITGVVGIVNVLVGAWGILSAAATIFGGVITTLVGIVGAPFLIISAGIALVIAGIVGVIRRWDQVKAAFTDGGILAGMKAIAGAFFAGIGDMLMLPITLAKEAVMGFLKWVVPLVGKIGSGIFSALFGMPVSKQTDAMAQPPKTLLPPMQGNPPPTISANNQDVAAPSTALAQETNKQSVMVQPPSAKEIAQETAAAMPLPAAGGKGGNTTVNLTGKLEARVSGNDLNILLAKAQVSQAEKNGRTVDPGMKRRVQQNGIAFQE